MVLSPLQDIIKTCWQHTIWWVESNTQPTCFVAFVMQGINSLEDPFQMKKYFRTKKPHAEMTSGCGNFLFSLETNIIWWHHWFITHKMRLHGMFERRFFGRLRSCFYWHFFLTKKRTEETWLTTNTNLLVISIARVAGDREVLQQVNAVIFIISTDSSFQKSLPMIVIPATQKETRGINLRHTSPTRFVLKIIKILLLLTSEPCCTFWNKFIRTKLSPADHSGPHKLPE